MPFQWMPLFIAGGVIAVLAFGMLTHEPHPGASPGSHTTEPRSPWQSLDVSLQTDSGEEVAAIEFKLLWFDQQRRGAGSTASIEEAFRELLLRHDPVSVLGWMERTLTPETQRCFYGPFFRVWAALDGMAAAHAAFDLSPPANADLVGQALSTWAEADLAGALGWASALPSGEIRSAAFVQTSYYWARTDPAAAAEHARAEDDHLRLKTVLGAWAENDPATAAAWLVAQTMDSLPGDAFELVAAAWSRRFPEDAAQFVADLPPGATQNRAALEVVSAWGYYAPEQTAVWVERFPESAVREQAMERLGEIWASHDPPGLALWLQALPPSRSRDWGLSALSATIQDSYPEIAAQWAALIESEPLRTRRTESAASRWMKQDATSALEWISHSELPASIKDWLYLENDRVVP